MIGRVWNLVWLATALVVSASSAQCASGNEGSTTPCYLEPLLGLPPSPDSRIIPWGSPGIVNGTSTCCTSLDEVRAGIDNVDQQLLKLLSQRAALVKEATRFKSTRDKVNDPTRNAQVIERAINNSVNVHLPQVIADSVYTAIINSSVQFELCVFDSFGIEAR
ncbi:hypothetical protein CC1G_11435 [Coprinopsis cinerea okayama7|uniref:Chorismate mutase domain-containing protein n=1 Tax=Coprinopsis cinerea (strain Okayama-7 / 130 / ATCC MYA-4618 / FGSC 9003) TaxID=240176 RepID=A8P050_COPC7|nr:hypothetical protein CC1G_11435 [Coprinopsis cinerea okayama7\|eukprot:XP_001837790.2 hypothetical protein CC1G_11435 [Coprinopsis cinerea okayama7\